MNMAHRVVEQAELEWQPVRPKLSCRIRGTKRD